MLVRRKWELAEVLKNFACSDFRYYFFSKNLDHTHDHMFFFQKLIAKDLGYSHRKVENGDAGHQWDETLRENTKLFKENSNVQIH